MCVCKTRMTEGSNHITLCQCVINSYLGPILPTSKFQIKTCLSDHSCYLFIQATILIKKLKIFSELNFSYRVIFVVTLFTFICYTFFSAAHCFSKNKIYAGMYLLAGKCRNIIQIIPLPNHPNRIIVRSIPNDA